MAFLNYIAIVSQILSYNLIVLLMISNQMRATLQARIDQANQEKEQAEAEKRQKEESALNLLNIENEFMAKVADESRNLDAEEEACTKVIIPFTDCGARSS